MLALYCGESGRNTYSRGLEHKESIETQKKGQPIPDHILRFHANKDLNSSNFHMKVTKNFNKPLQRIISEGHQIDSLISMRESDGNTIVMNSRNNYHQAKTIKLGAQKQDY